ncbi:unnamed protein product, partial [Effrenium voratum]
MVISMLIAKGFAEQSHGTVGPRLPGPRRQCMAAAASKCQSAVANDASRFQDGTEVQAWRLQEIHLVRDVQVHGAQSHREEFAALREGEQAQRAVKRRGRPPEPFEAAEGLAGAQLLEELQALQARCQQLEENSQMAARGAEEARRAAALSAERAEVAERRAWATAE